MPKVIKVYVINFLAHLIVFIYFGWFFIIFLNNCFSFYISILCVSFDMYSRYWDQYTLEPLESITNALTSNHDFELVSSLKISLEKNELISIGRVENINEFANKLSCRVNNLSFKCLGIPFGAYFKSTPIWDLIEERFKRRLVLWRNQFLSKGERLTVLKSRLSS